MKTTHAPRRSRIAAAAFVASCAALSCLPAHAQFGSLFNNILQMQQQQQAQEVAKKAAAQAALNANPAKVWPAAKPVPPTVQAAASEWAGNVPGAPTGMQPLLERLYVEGERNATLNFQRIGMAALAAGNVDMAERAFEAAVVRIDQIYADNPEAQKAKSLWTAEKIKDFKGEPYERAMAYFYRGLVYAARGDFQNARAMFKQADYQDTVAEAEQYAGDFGLMPYMAGWSSYCDGNTQLSADFLKMAAKGDKAYEGAATDRPVLVLFESGRAPFKYGAGKFGEELKWQAHAGTAPVAQAACVAAGSQCVVDKFMVGADIGYQATTRGGRPIDAVLGGKASFKEGAQTASTVAGTIGAVGLQTALVTGNRDSGTIGMVGMFAGLVAQNMAQSTQAQADIREWEQLPGTVWLGTGTAKVAADTLLVGAQVTSSFSGIGITMKPEGGAYKIVGVMDGAPAARAGVKADDVITMVGGTPVAGMSQADLTAKLRGEPNTPVALSVNRPSELRSLEVTITRDTIVNPVVQLTAKRLVDTPQCQLYWGRVASPIDTLKDAGPLEPGEHPRDPAFRQELQAFFGS